MMQPIFDLVVNIAIYRKQDVRANGKKTSIPLTMLLPGDAERIYFRGLACFPHYLTILILIFRNFLEI
jgi:hypothetical protein